MTLSNSLSSEHFEEQNYTPEMWLVTEIDLGSAPSRVYSQNPWERVNSEVLGDMDPILRMEIEICNLPQICHAGLF